MARSSPARFRQHCDSRCSARPRRHRAQVRTRRIISRCMLMGLGRRRGCGAGDMAKAGRWWHWACCSGSSATDVNTGIGRLQPSAVNALTDGIGFVVVAVGVVFAIGVTGQSRRERKRREVFHLQGDQNVSPRGGSPALVRHDRPRQTALRRVSSACAGTARHISPLSRPIFSRRTRADPSASATARIEAAWRGGESRQQCGRRQWHKLIPHADLWAAWQGGRDGLMARCAHNPGHPAGHAVDDAGAPRLFWA